MSPEPLLVAEGVSKRFGASVALADVTVRVGRGAIHGLLGKNGAGKSTLAGVIAGLVDPDAGQVLFDGEDVTGEPAAHRQRRGIRLLSQHAEVLPDLSVTENLFLGELPRRHGFVDWQRAHRDAHDVLTGHGLDVPVRRRAGGLSLSERRRLTIVRALRGEGRLVVLDEPTAGLTLGERRDLLRWVHRLAAEGRTFVFISHHNDEVRQLCTEYTVLRDGQVVAAAPDSTGLTAARVATLVSGTDVHEFRRDVRPRGDVVLRLDGLRFGGFGPVDLSVRAGEIVGLVGLPGSGAQELLRALAGIIRIDGGLVAVGDRSVARLTPASARSAGIAYLTQDRMGEGVVPEMSVLDNLHLGRWATGRFRTLDLPVIRRRTEDRRRDLAIAMRGPGQQVRELSGGNQQKVLIGRLLEAQPRVLLLDEPTVGIDVAAKEEIHRLVDRATGEGMAVLLRAYDPDETARLVDRAVVFAGGVATEELAGDRLTVDAVATTQHLAAGRET